MKQSHVRSPKLLLCALLLALGGSEACLATSIIFPAFSAPIVSRNRAYFYCTPGKVVFCFDLKKNELAWRRDLGRVVDEVLLSPDGDVLALSGHHVLVLSPQTGKTLREQTIPGWRVKIDAQGRMIVYETLIQCIDYATGKKLWDSRLPDESNVEFKIAGEFLFVLLTPRQIVFEHNVPRIDKGRSELLAMKMTDGTLAWREAVPLSHSGYGASLEIRPAGDWLACATDTVIRLIESRSGIIRKRYEAETDIKGVDWWGTDRLVLCLGNIGSHQKRIRIITAEDFKTLSEFGIEAREAAGADIVGDVLLVGSLYRNYGIDLIQKKAIWTAFQRSRAVVDGRIYYGAAAESGDRRFERLFGICEPTTGKTTVLYREPVESARSQPTTAHH